MLHIVSTMVLLILLTGVYFRRRREIHTKLMTSAFVIDLALVLYIELTRHAVGTVTTQVRPLLWFHAAISTSVLVLYVVMIVLGRKMLAGAEQSMASGAGSLNVGITGQTRTLHRNLGMTFLALRVVSYVTAFMI